MTHPLVASLGLRPHPEGGWFAETWRSDTVIDTPRGPRSSATGILFLLEAGQTAAWHRVSSAELWLHHSGSGLELLLAGNGPRPGPPERLLLGVDVAAGQQPQVLVPGGCWQSATPTGADAVLVSCVVSPGFDYADFEMLPPAG
jgi:predicted cupin superfamily sugar epimerase